MTRRKPELRSWSVLVLLALISLTSNWASVAADRIFKQSGTPATAYLLVIFQELLLYGVPGLIYISQARGITLPQLTEKHALTLKPLLLTALAATLHQGAMTLLTGLMDQFLKAQGISALGAGMPVPSNTADFILALFAIVILPAFCEESLFRRGVLSCLRREFSDLNAILFTALLFAMMHGSLAGFPAHLFTGLVLTYLCFATGSLVFPMVYHLVFNLISLLLSMFPALILPLPLAAALICLAILLGLMALMPLFSNRQPMASRKASAFTVIILCVALLLLLPKYILPLLP